MLGGYAVLFPRARILTIIFIILFFGVVELPALLVLGFWFLSSSFGARRWPSARRRAGVAYFAHIGGFVVRPGHGPAFAAGAAAAAGPPDARLLMRQIALYSTLAFLALLAFLTVSVIARDGLDILSLISLLVLGMLGFGIVGALLNPPEE